VALAFAPSSFMLAVTTYITTELAAVPLLWVIPLALYLLTFIVVFSRSPSFLYRLLVLLQPLVALQLVALVALRVSSPLVLVVAVNLLAMFVSALVCHGRLAADRPASSHLTEFYLWLAVGGALGGVFNAVVAPVLFKTVLEYPLAIVLACMLRGPAHGLGRSGDPTPGTSSAGSRSRAAVAVPLATGLLTVAVAVAAHAAGLSPVAARTVAVVAGLVACATVTARPVRFGLALGAVMLAAAVPLAGEQDTLYANRTFFGVIRVRRDAADRVHRLVHGNTTHGVQSTDPSRRLEPLGYYDRSGPVSDVFGAPVAGSAGEVAVLGLGTGTLACYGRPGQRWTFYEIDAAVRHVARDPRLFTYLRDCPPRSHVVVGDGRLSLRREADRKFGVIVMDAFNSDSVPVHLLTRQALALYLHKLADGGIVVVNVTNRYLDLRPVLGDLARDAGLVALSRDDLRVGRSDPRAPRYGSVWVVMARRRQDLGPLAADPRWAPLPHRRGGRVWTDDYSNLLSALKRG
jgi:hypothetical protein